MRFMFMDEAGTSAKEPVTVIVGVIANADEHVMSAEALVGEALGGVPEQFRGDFVFHATSVFGDQKYQKGWSLTDRLGLLHTMMSIPRRIGMAICLSVHWRGAVDYSDVWGKPFNMSAAQSDHIQAFIQCVGVADRSIRQHCGPREVATIVAEDVPEMRKMLRLTPTILRKHPFVVPQEWMRKTVHDEEAGHIQQGGEMRVTRIRNAIHFVDKADDPLVQVADAVAYGLRRYFAKEKFGEDFASTILGDSSLLRAFASPGGVSCYWPPNSGFR